ncbi:cyanophycin synthetase [Cylindrospermopsis raciborskii]|uniref:Cyanophycin synthetase n=1 Tax=Cylindrospermopsis raciborskii CENA302 TaxID=1170768 RepID=A0A9Q5QYZ3_9CYAN|nr:cyanophycin synthetase [Cylindrospermopsis raciborskii]MCZ2200922.1 cyanophycin synthetase [Cylindrospermopsis raciborskii PAMP2012]MCZ2206501.1 cyanophycin synthetase [Cylindrospermopsis raciborskii PAMP2011]NLQ03815.1 cyanophycin synthetase [Cylindrospermopsis raciborskii MVCC19]OHY34002.1 cyanophycin synthetase [Cylindrospermopsis raciborskii MVCC14]OPH10981.1 cyanophycin synthetase [Cylindrospermopsis raciborskii CENA302]
MRFTASILHKIATEIGAKILIEPEYELIGHITFRNGKRTVFRNTRFNINGFGSANLAQDKAFSNYFLGTLGYKVTEGKTFLSDKMCQKVASSRNIDEGWQYAQELGLPVIVKPLNLSSGVLVTKVYNENEYYEVAKKIFNVQSVLIVERFYLGNDFRILVLDNEVMAAYQRIPLSITGNGKSTILELLTIKREELVKTVQKISIDLGDFRIFKNLQKQNLTFESIVPPGVIVYLLDNANLSTGGQAVDMTDNIHPDFQQLAINITKDMGLRLAGVDILTPDITQPLVDYTLLEVNSAPGLTHYASLGEKQRQQVEYLYRKILQELEKA